ncbi:acetyl-CoA C-acyltransferase [Peribacillus cavernae]|uniref:acetyl-CoA C-acetyltransferase n=1 Tax=Peribacillus cavernae TaxID=1674310 RepID=A0A3S0VII2_9BACI|nr:acetyl-CoA C-acyltransferase [Peribacillus cavernae]MDQ0218105.1 acetyl-CoA C-acetyltransferase [Peribacillus cavernae]RUQ32738.1 acetyl-CoA C-acyltransferase [Peribacillus cavernae]
MVNQENPIIVAGCRTAFGQYGGILRDVPATKLGASVIEQLIQTEKISRDDVSKVIMGHCIPSVDENVPARQVVIEANLPNHVPSLTINRACCSSMTAVGLAYSEILADPNSLIIAGGMENMSRVPIPIPDLRWGSRLGSITIQDPLVLADPIRGKTAAEDAGAIAVEHGIGRELQDEWAYVSQQRYESAKKRGIFAEEIQGIEVVNKRKEIMFLEDEFPKPATTLEKLSKLATIYNSPTVTAGNAPGLDAGAAALAITSMEKVRNKELSLLAEIVAYTEICGDSGDIATTPARAIIQALEKANLSFADLKLLEINEAFAAVPLTSTKVLAETYGTSWDLVKEITNVNGGAIAIGHPVGASGARIILTLALELKRRGGGYGAAAICGGMGQGDCVIIKV